MKSKRASLSLRCLLAAGAALGAAGPPDFRCSEGAREVPEATVDVVREAEGELQVSWRFPTRESLWGYEFPEPPELARYRRWLDSVKTTPRRKPDPAWPGYALEQRINEFAQTRRFGTLRPMNCLEATLLSTQISRTGAEAVWEFVAYVLRSEASSETKVYFLAGPGEFPPRDNLVRPLIREDLESGWWLHSVIHNHTGPHPVAAPSASDAQYGMSWVEVGAQRFIVINGTEAFDVSGPELRRFLEEAKRDGI